MICDGLFSGMPHAGVRVTKLTSRSFFLLTHSSLFRSLFLSVRSESLLMFFSRTFVPLPFDWSPTDSTEQAAFVRKKERKGLHF